MGEEKQRARNIWEFVAVGVFLVLLALLAFRALNNPTGKVHIYDELPASLEALWKPATPEGERHVQATIDENDTATVLIDGRTFTGRAILKKSNRTEALYRIGGTNEAGEPISITTILPLRAREGIVEGQWTMSLIEYVPDQKWSVRITLKPGGDALFVQGLWDIFGVEEKDVQAQELPGTWSAETKDGVTTVTVDVPGAGVAALVLSLRSAQQ